MKKRLLFIVFLLLPLLMLSTMVQAKTDRNFITHLSVETPQVVTRGQGQAIFKLSKDGESISYRLIVANIRNVTMAHIHLSQEVGGDGPPVVWLYPDAPPPMLIPGRSQGTLRTGTFTAEDLVGPLAGMEIAELIRAINEGLVYVNVHTTAYPGGEIRGNIR